MPSLVDGLATWSAAARAQLAGLPTTPRLDEVGRVEEVGDDVASVSGLPGTRLDELLRFPDGSAALAVSLDVDRIGCVLLGGAACAAGTRVRCTGAVARVPVGDALLGRIVDALGRPLDAGPPILPVRRDPVERAGGRWIIERDFVTRPLPSGITVVDAVVPLGRGQRELVLGDRKLRQDRDRRSTR